LGREEKKAQEENVGCWFPEGDEKRFVLKKGKIQAFLNNHRNEKDGGSEEGKQNSNVDRGREEKQGWQSDTVLSSKSLEIFVVITSRSEKKSKDRAKKSKGKRTVRRRKKKF